MNYDHTIILVTPIANKEVAKRLSRSLDPDVGGYEAFELEVEKDGLRYITYSSPCTATFSEEAPYLLSMPEQLHAVVSADYAIRWPEFEAPSLSEITEFCSSVLCIIDSTLDGFTFITSNQEV